MPSTLIFHKRDETFQAQRRLQTMSETEKAPLMDSGAFRAERTRFELVVRVTPYVGLANRWFQPLTHLSGHAFRLLTPKGCANIESF